MRLFGKKEQPAPAPAQPEQVIRKDMPYDVALTQLEAWQQEKDVKFHERLAALVVEGQSWGLETKRMARGFLAAGATLAGPGGKNGVGS